MKVSENIGESGLCGGELIDMTKYFDSLGRDWKGEFLISDC